MSPLSVHLTIVYLIHRISTCPLQTYSVSLAGLVCYVCGHCQQGLSAVFAWFIRCSNVYLLIIIPLAIAGVVLVLFLFILELTVTNGTITTAIFYVNIINTNYSTLLPNCYSPNCVLLSITNFDLGIETYFYNNITGYAKI